MEGVLFPNLITLQIHDDIDAYIWIILKVWTNSIRSCMNLNSRCAFLTLNSILHSILRHSEAGLLCNWSPMQVQWLLGRNALLGTKTATTTPRTGARHVSRPTWITAVTVTTSVPPIPTALPPAQVANAAPNAAVAGRIATPTVRMDAKPMWAMMWRTAEAAARPAPPTPTAWPPAPEASADTLAPRDGRIATARKRTDARPMWARMWTTVENVATSAPAPTLTLWPFAGSVLLAYSVTKCLFQNLNF